MGHPSSRAAGPVVAMLLLTVLAAPGAEAVTFTNATLLIRWDGAGCLGSITGTSLTAFADASQNAYDKLAYFPGTATTTRCTGELLEIAFTNLAKWESVGNILYVFSATITDASGSVGFFTPFNLKLTCTGTNYVHAGGVTCNSKPGPNSYLGVRNNVPANPTISSLYPNFPDPQTSLYLSWTGVSPMPSDFDWWEVHMSKTPDFVPSYSFPSTLLARRTWGFQHLAVENLEPGTQYCFLVRNADRYWEPDNFLTRPHPSYGQSAERCATTHAGQLRVTSPNGGEVWSKTHSVTWSGGNPNFKVELSADGGATFATLATGVGARAWSWDTTKHADGTSYVVRVADAGASDASDARFTLDNTPPVTTMQAQGSQCNGWYTAPPTVTLAATDNLAGVRTTWWNVDGGAARAYGGPFALAGDGRRDLGWWSDDRADPPNVEARRNATLRIDTLPPESRLQVGSPRHDADRVYVNSSTPLALEASDAGSGVNYTEYRIDGGAWQRYGGPFSLAGPDGDTVVGFRSADHACHLEDERTFALFLDNTHPTVDFAAPRPGSLTVGSTKVDALDALLALLRQAEAQLPPELRAQLAALGAEAEAARGRVPLSAEDLCTVARILARALRDAGQGGVADLLEGLLCAPRGSDAAVVAGAVLVEADAEDPVVNGGASGMQRVDFLVDGALRASDATSPYQWGWNTTQEQPGTHELAVVAYDNLGQATTARLTVLVLPSGPDNLDPVLRGLPLPQAVRELLDFARGKLPV